MNKIPILYRNRNLFFDPDTLEQLKFLNWKRGYKPGHYSNIVNDALTDFFKVKFEELGIEHYVDVEAEHAKKREEEELRAQEQDRENRRLLSLAKLRIIEREIEKIKKEEAKEGKKTELPKDIKRTLHNYKM
jgi:predicted TIM-barrel fold metal-dependent hydrolase